MPEMLSIIECILKCSLHVIYLNLDVSCVEFMYLHSNRMLFDELSV